LLRRAYRIEEPNLSTTMSLFKKGNTCLNRSEPNEVNTRTGHRLLCADGKVREAEIIKYQKESFRPLAVIKMDGMKIQGYADTTEDAYIFSVV